MLSIQETVKNARRRSGLHVRVTGLPEHDVFDYYAATEAQRDEFIQRYTARGFTCEIVAGIPGIPLTGH